MKQVTAKQAAWMAFPTLPLPRLRRRENIATESVEAVEQVTSATEVRRWVEDLFTISLLCVMAVTTVVATAWVSREFLGELLRHNSLDLLRGFGAM